LKYHIQLKKCGNIVLFFQVSSLTVSYFILTTIHVRYLTVERQPVCCCLYIY